jgi:hypothetical protein
MKNILVFLFLTALISLCAATVDHKSKSSTDEDIEISVTVTLATDAKTLVRCGLTNHSRHVLASSFTRSDSKGFRFILKDARGNTVPMNEQWALIHAQPDGTNDSALDRRSLSGIYIHPGKS